MSIKINKLSERISENGCTPSATNHHLTVTVDFIHSDVWAEVDSKYSGCVDFSLDSSIISEKLKRKTLDFRYTVKRNDTPEEREIIVTVCRGTKKLDKDGGIQTEVLESEIFTLIQEPGTISSFDCPVILSNEEGVSKLVAIGKSVPEDVEFRGCPEWLSIETVERYGGEDWPGFNTRWKYYTDVIFKTVENNISESRSAEIEVYLNDEFKYTTVVSQKATGILELYGDSASDSVYISGEVYKYPNHFFLKRRNLPVDLKFHYRFVTYDTWYEIKRTYIKNGEWCEIKNEKCGSISKLIDQFAIYTTETNPSEDTERVGSLRVYAVSDETDVVLAVVDIPIIQPGSKK